MLAETRRRPGAAWASRAPGRPAVGQCVLGVGIRAWAYRRESRRPECRRGNRVRRRIRAVLPEQADRASTPGLARQAPSGPAAEALSPTRRPVQATVPASKAASVLAG